MRHVGARSDPDRHLVIFEGASTAVDEAADDRCVLLTAAVAIASLASDGHLVNAVYDVDTDPPAGMSNATAGDPLATRSGACVTTALAGTGRDAVDGRRGARHGTTDDGRSGDSWEARS